MVSETEGKVKQNVTQSVVPVRLPELLESGWGLREFMYFRNSLEGKVKQNGITLE